MLTYQLFFLSVLQRVKCNTEFDNVRFHSQRFKVAEVLSSFPVDDFRTFGTNLRIFQCVKKPSKTPKPNKPKPNELHTHTLFHDLILKLS